MIDQIILFMAINWAIKAILLLSTVGSGVLMIKRWESKIKWIIRSLFVTFLLLTVFWFSWSGAFQPRNTLDAENPASIQHLREIDTIPIVLPTQTPEPTTAEQWKDAQEQNQKDSDAAVERFNNIGE